MSARELITEHLDLWTGAVTKKPSSGRGSNGKVELTGVKKLRELILELAVRGRLVSRLDFNQSSSDLIAVIEKEKSRLVASKRIKKPKAVGSVSQENYPFDIPENWSWHTLGELGYTQTGSTPAKSKSELFGSDIPFLKPGDISENGEICYENEGLSEAGKETLGKWAETDSILMVCIGTIGKCGLIQQQCTFNQQINSISPFVPGTSRFLLLCLQSPYFQRAAWEKSSSTTISILNKGKWESIPVPLPPLEEQHRIVQKVDELMALCDRLEQQTSDQLEAHETLVDTLLGTLTQSENATELADNWAHLAAHFDTLFTTEQSIDKLKQTILQLAVMGRLVEQDAGDESAQELLRSLAAEERRLLSTGKLRRKNSGKTGTNQSALQELPSGWALAPLSQLGRFSGGKTPSKSKPQFWGGHIPWVTPKDMKTQHIKGSEDRVTQLAVDEGLELYPENAVLFVVRSGILRRMFPAAITAVPCTVNQDLKVLSPYLPELSPYIQLMMLGFEQFILKNLTKTGTTVESLKFEEFANCQFPIPPLHEQARILERVDEVMILCDQLKERLNQASETRNQLAEAVVEGALN